MDSIELVGKRCPKGYTINKKTGRCNKKTVKMQTSHSLSIPMPILNEPTILKTPLSPRSIELVGKRCPTGYTKNKKTGRCNKKQNIKELTNTNNIPMQSLFSSSLAPAPDLDPAPSPKSSLLSLASSPKPLGESTLKWDITDSYIFGKNVNLTNLQNIKNVYLFDLDYTLIKTISKKKFPVNKDDWEVLYSTIPAKLSSDESTLIGIVSNQKGLKTESDRNDFIDKITNISKIMRIDFMFASLEDNKYRKPMCGSFDFIKSQYSNSSWERVSYIGDAAGRKRDHSDTDYKYAINCGMDFFTPEQFFEEAGLEENPAITYPDIKYLSSKEEMELFKRVDDVIKRNDKVIILMVGFPASGKSYVRNKILEKYSEFVYTNNDDIKGKVKDERLVKKMEGYNFIIDDNTNLRERGEKLKGYEDYYKLGIWFDYSMDVCFHLNYVRMYSGRGKLMPKIVYYTLNKKYDRDVIGGGEFDDVISINKLFSVFKNGEIKYYF